MVFQKEFVMLTSTPVRSKPRSKLNDSDIQAIPDEKGRIVRKSKYHPDKTRELLTLDESDEEKEEVSLPGIPSFSMNSSNGENMGNSSFIESYDLGNKASKRPRILETSSSSEDTQDVCMFFENFEQRKTYVIPAEIDYFSRNFSGTNFENCKHNVLIHNYLVRI